MKLTKESRSKLFGVMINPKLFNNKTSVSYFINQLELSTESKILHYQLAIKVNSLCTKKSRKPLLMRRYGLIERI